MLHEILDRARRDPAYAKIHAQFAEAGIENWLQDDEKVLHFAVGAFAPGCGALVEIGSFKGGSACFLAAGLARRGQGRLTCVDPHLGGPPWLGMSPAQRTLDEFRRGVQTCGVADRIDVRLGDSAAVAAVWPAEPIDAVLIDGDHSFLGALRDFECWGPKVNPDGLVLIDDSNDPGVPEVAEMVGLVKTLSSVRYLDNIEGIAVFRRTEIPAWEMMTELSRACAARRIYRPWDWSPLHRMTTPMHYLRSKTWTDITLDTGYQLGFLARCGPGPYGYTASSAPGDRAILRALSRDRGDGEVVEIGGASEKIRQWFGQPRARFRVILCRPEEAKTYAPRLLPGGLLLSRPDRTGDVPFHLDVCRVLMDAGLEGCGYHLNSLHWGIWQPHQLAADAILNFAVAGAA